MGLEPGDAETLGHLGLGEAAGIVHPGRPRRETDLVFHHTLAPALHPAISFGMRNGIILDNDIRHPSGVEGRQDAGAHHGCFTAGLGIGFFVLSPD
ncbi:hypothetical protein STAQ_34730 [Allostella sp. ATCC 35155]|nr:hypothetical protein STAQ_34730 [Stella sp. ATCC 35155]